MPVHGGATQSAKCADASDELDLRRVSRILRDVSSKTVVPNLERAFNLDTEVIRVFMGKEGANCTECSKVQCRHFLGGVELFWQEPKIVLVGLGPRQIPQ